MRSLRDSLITRIGVALGAVIFLALVNIAVSLYVSASARGDAAAINQSGLIRMETQRLITRAERFENSPSAENRQFLERQIDTISGRLIHPRLVNAIPGLDHPVGNRYHRLRLTWSEFLKPRFEALLETGAPLGHAPVMARTFIEEVDAMVEGLESRTESRITLLGVIQGLSLLLTLAVVAVLFLDFRRNVLHPLGRLVAMAQAVAKQDFSLRTQASGRDELSLLGQTFDRMADELSVRYANLEARAESKTKELERSHRALQLLHKASRSLYGSADLCEGSVPLLQQLESLLDIGPVSLYLHERENEGAFEAVTTFARTRPEHCRSLSCDACLTGCHVLEDQPEAHRNRLMLPVRTGEELLGTLEVWYARDRILQHHERQLLETLADQLATAVYLNRRMTEQNRLTLMEERTVIARELHDSLAQSLSYLKMQVARLQRLQGEGDTEPDPREAEVVQDLRDGLNNGYRQLRELLTTFRLQFDSPGLEEALRQTSEEFSERLGFHVDLDYHVPPRMFSPNEEIHILQIVREALANVHKHAQASHAQVSVYQLSGTLMVEVRDNGVGLPANGAPPSHYGLVIMRDRSLTLGGELSVANAEGGGTVVRLAIPQQASSIITQAS
ncbi:two-component system nitrate/nitrite sensor histidine kinase NarX [Halospina denitrificans]|uniref:Sensor protein n=1 Tax=Halospina denitrificans TaxID=332522 RepID=A0A4R7K2X4_9GAMM|nr:histidine kinase [Halospina denitrificans]TDT44293.1 two-component system nitrate/nitrite sensor histidine kinase NarX [Halospina denitrificans]